VPGNGPRTTVFIKLAITRPEDDGPGKPYDATYRVDYAGTRNKACLTYTPEAGVGDYVLVHAGFALQVLDEDEALASLQELSRLAGFMAADQNDPDAAEQ
jgi:hydrogenase expression/formation protein HypC